MRNWRKYAPPGMDLEKEKGYFLAGMLVSILYSVLYYFEAYGDEYRRMWRGSGAARVPVEQYKIPPFVELLDNCLVGYVLLGLSMFAVVGFHYAHYRQGSKSIYLMRRLPDGGYLHRTCWTLPLAGMMVCALAAAVSLALFFAVYVLYTPRACLPW